MARKFLKYNFLRLSFSSALGTALGGGKSFYERAETSFDGDFVTGIMWSLDAYIKSFEARNTILGVKVKSGISPRLSSSQRFSLNFEHLIARH